MKIAVCLFKYFPFGGMQRDFFRVCQQFLNRGHHVDVFTTKWQGPVLEDVNISIVPVYGMTNHGKNLRFAKKANLLIQLHKYHTVIGFDKIPGLDWYFAADICFAEKAISRGLFYRMTGRYRTYLSLERIIFEKESKTKIFVLTEKQKAGYQKHYGTDEDRFCMLPPGIKNNPIVQDQIYTVRTELRRHLGIDKKGFIALFIGSSFRSKGLDRAITAISSLPESFRQRTTLIVVGQDRKQPYERLARRMKVSDRIIFVGGRKDTPKFFAAADVLLHPAYTEAAGMVLIEAMNAGVPVLTTDICGYAFHIERAKAGEVIPSPFKQNILNDILLQMLASERGLEWKKNGLEYVRQNDFFSLPEKFVDIVEKALS